MDRCPCCEKELKIDDYDTYYDPEVDDTDYATSMPMRDGAEIRDFFEEVNG